jgi:F0F1-type ATP synthase assembly protein I
MPASSFYQRLGRLSSIILVLPGSMAGGWLLGYFVVDRMLSTFPWGSVLVTLLGAGAGFYEIVKILIQDRRQEGDAASEQKH